MTVESPRTANSVDAHVGSRIRLRRQLIKMTQQKLAEQLGITFQQVQKYERGSNRVSASRLYLLSIVLDVPVSFFFEGIDGAVPGDEPRQASKAIMELISSRDGVKLAEAYNSISDSAVRRRILMLVRSLSE